MTNFQKKLQNHTEPLKLTDNEKAAMRATIRRAMNGEPQSIPSPYGHYFNSWRSAFAGALVVVLVSGTTAFAAQSTLPGDTLYGVKINVTEPIVGAFKVTPHEQVAYHTALVERRAEEAERLAAQGLLTPERAATIESNLDQHAAAALDTAVDTSADATEVDEVSSEIGASLAAHSAVLTAIDSTNKTDEPAQSLAKHMNAQSSVLLSFGEASPGSSSAPVALATSSDSFFSKSAPWQRAFTQSGIAQSTSSSPTSTSKKSYSSDVAAIRSQALSYIQSAQDALKAADGSLDQSTNDTISAQLSAAKQNISQADTMGSTSAHTALSKYRLALRSAVSISTLLRGAGSNTKVLQAVFKSQKPQKPGTAATATSTSTGH